MYKLSSRITSLDGINKPNTKLMECLMVFVLRRSCAVSLVAITFMGCSSPAAISDPAPSVQNSAFNSPNKYASSTAEIICARYKEDLQAGSPNRALILQEMARFNVTEYSCTGPTKLAPPKFSYGGKPPKTQATSSRAALSDEELCDSYRAEQASNNRANLAPILGEMGRRNLTEHGCQSGGKPARVIAQSPSTDAAQYGTSTRSSADANANETDGDRANKEIFLCQYKAALQLDDGVSDVNSIAPAVADSCRAESENFYWVLRRDVKGPINEQQVQQAMRQRNLQTARTVVLMKRAEDRKKK